MRQICALRAERAQKEEAPFDINSASIGSDFA